jgi:hypothetical protein
MSSIRTITLPCVLRSPPPGAQTARSGFITTSDGIRIYYMEAGEVRGHAPRHRSLPPTPCKRTFYNFV